MLNKFQAVILFISAFTVATNSRNVYGKGKEM